MKLFATFVLFFTISLNFSAESFALPECANGNNGDFDDFEAVCWMPSPTYPGTKSVVYTISRESDGPNAGSACKESTIVFAPNNNYDHNIPSSFPIASYKEQPFCVKNVNHNLTIVIGGNSEQFNFNSPNVPRCDAGGTSSQNYVWFLQQCAAYPLPVTLSEFTVQQGSSADAAAIAWKTESESNSDYFSVQESKDGTSFTEIANVKAAGFSNQTKSYQASAQNLTAGIHYFRLVQVDFDGSKNISFVQALKIAASTENKFTLFPNPVTGVSAFVSNLVGDAELVVVNSFGQIVFAQSLTSGESRSNIDAFAFPSSGAYLYRVIQNGTELSQGRFIVINGK